LPVRLIAPDPSFADSVSTLWPAPSVKLAKATARSSPSFAASKIWSPPSTY
jgi:hypothetical protein